MTDDQFDKLLSLMERQTTAMESIAKSLGANGENASSIPHGDISSELKFLRRIETLHTGMLLSNSNAEPYNISMAIDDVVNYATKCTKKNIWSDKEYRVYNNSRVNFRSDLIVGQNGDDCALQIAYKKD